MDLLDRVSKKSGNKTSPDRMGVLQPQRGKAKALLLAWLSASLTFANRRAQQARSAAPRRLDRGHVNLLHFHHRFKRALGFSAAGGKRLGQHARRDLPGDAPSVFAPAALALLAAIADDGVPVAVGLLLIVGGDLEREGLVMFEHGAAVEPDTGDAGDGELDRQHVALLAG